MYDIVIIGGGPAGLTAAIYAIRAGLRLLVLEEGQLGGQVAVSAEVENYPAVPHTMGWKLAFDMAQQVQGMDVPIRYEQVLGLEDHGAEKTVVTSAGSYSCRAVVIANGARRRKLGCPGEDTFLGRGVSYCATCDGAFFRGKDVAVMGGGNTALEDAIYLSGICRSVTLLFRRQAPTAQRRLVETAQSRANLRMLPLTRVAAIEGEEMVRSLTLCGPDGEEKGSLPVSGIFVAIGLAPDNARFAPLVALDEYGYIVSDEACKTNVPGIFCAGDTRTKLLRQIVTAVSDGAVAATQAERYIASLG